MNPKKWQNLSLREKIGQTMLIKAVPESQIQKYGGLDDFLEQYPVGGIFVASEIIKDAADGPARVSSIIGHYRKAGRIPLLFAADMENGCGSTVKGMTALPVLMALGATGSVELAYAYGQATALEARSLGINWAFTPVSDLNLNRFNPVINVRSVSDDPELAKCLLFAVVKGMQDHGLAATAKHFPGDGVDYRDQHLVTTANTLSAEEWWRNHGAVFKSLVNGGVSAVMTGHIALPFYQTPTSDGRYLPATLSRELTTDLLKQELDFNGVVVSDALNMGGFLGWHERRAQAELASFKAGTDMLLWPTLEYCDLLEQAILSEEVSQKRLDDAVSRIWALKEKLGLFNEGYPVDPVLNEDDKYFVRGSAVKIGEQSITLVRDRRKRLPLRPEKVQKAVIIGITPHDRDFGELGVLKTALEERGVKTTLIRNLRFGELPGLCAEYDLIIYALISRPHAPRGPVNLFGPEADSIWTSLTEGISKSLVVSFGSPYYCTEYFEAADIYINAYSIIPASQRAVVKALCGEIPFMGCSPVRL